MKKCLWAKNVIILLYNLKLNFYLKASYWNWVIKSRLNKEVKKLKKLYQESIDGGNYINFYLRCYCIPNALVIIKSSVNRRFGCFTPPQWSLSSNGECNYKPNVFIFSLDKKMQK